MRRTKMLHDISVSKKYDIMETPVNLTDFEQYDFLTAFVFLREKEANQEIEEHKQDRYEVCAIHPDKSGDHYKMFLTYVMPCDELIEFVKTTTYRIVSIRKLRNRIRKEHVNE